MSNCHVSNQIAKHCDEPISDECGLCGSSMTECNSSTECWLECDNKDCDNTVDIN